VGHACLGQVFFSWICCIAAIAWSGDVIPDRRGDTNKMRRLALMTTGFVLFQLLFGAIFRHTGKMLHVHMAGAALVLIHVLLLERRIVKSSTDPWLIRPSQIMIGAVFLQIALGLYAWRSPTVLDATAHVAVGALILASAFVTSLMTFLRT
jgi:heme A synthase